MILRAIQSADVAAVSALGNRVYPVAYYEADETFSSKIMYPEGHCRLAEIDGVCVGYVISFPDIVGVPYPINTFFKPVKNPNCQYIHDLCVAPEYRGRGIAAQLLQSVLAVMPWNACALTAVMDSASFWSRHGFVKRYDILYCGQPAEYMLYNKVSR